MILWALIGLGFVAFVNNMVRNRRIDRYNRNVDRHNQMMEMLLKSKNETTDKDAINDTADAEKNP